MDEKSENSRIHGLGRHWQTIQCSLFPEWEREMDEKLIKEEKIRRAEAIQLAGERGYAEALPVLRKALSSPRRDAVIDIVAIGSVGLLGDSSDILRLSHFIKCDSRRAPAAEAAIRRINERSGAK